MTMSAGLNEVYSEQKAMISSISRPQQQELMGEQARPVRVRVVLRVRLKVPIFHAEPHCHYTLCMP